MASLGKNMLIQESQVTNDVKQQGVFYDFTQLGKNIKKCLQITRR